MGAAEPTTTMMTRLPRSMKDELESLVKSTGATTTPGPGGHSTLYRRGALAD
jgi:hypothetical protein